ncbi:MAG TPA: cupin domain-containing protein [Gaiellaceae bacterium]|nr:cupin domain-containing protein [Gaiellaceae bacterium]
MASYEIMQVGDVDEIDDGRSPFRPVRHRLGISAFGVNAWGPRSAGERLINEHDEAEPDGHEELYVVLSGRARFEIDGESVDAGTGSLVFVRTGARRTAFAAEDGTTLLAVGARAGAPYHPEGYELWAPLHAQYEAGEYAAVADRAAEVLADDPPYAVLHYNFACAASLAGRPDQALAHLRRGLELSERLRAWAKEDPDLEPLREDPRYRELVDP